MDGGRHGHFGQPAADELQHCHLSSGILHGHAIRPQAQVGLASLDLLLRGVIQVAIYNLLGQGEGTVKPGETREEFDTRTLCASTFAPLSM